MAMNRRALEDPGVAGRTGDFLQALPHEVADRLLAGSIRIDVPAGSVLYREGDSPRVLVVASGLLRIFLRSAEGRQVSVRYARSGDVAGLALLVGGPASIGIEAVTPTSVVALRHDDLRALLAIDPAVARACAEELAREFHLVLDDLAGQAFLTVGQRLARRLLDLAEHEDRRLVVRASQQQLADAVGSVREVVTRTLHRFREEGLIETGRDGIVLKNPAALAGRAQDGVAPATR